MASLLAFLLAFLRFSSTKSRQVARIDTSSAYASGREEKRGLRRRSRPSTAEERERLLQENNSKENIPPTIQEEQEQDSSGDEHDTDAVDPSSPLQSPASSARVRAPLGYSFLRQSVQIFSDVFEPSHEQIDATREVSFVSSERLPASQKLPVDTPSPIIPSPIISTSDLPKHTVSSDSTKQDTLQTDAPQTPDGTDFCLECITARRDVGYEKKMIAFLDRLYCSACGQEHGKLFFSAHQRQKEDADRVCVGYEGYMKICPHQTISLRTLDEWADTRAGRAGWHSIGCDEPSCAASGNLKVFRDLDSICHQILVNLTLTVNNNDKNQDIKQAVVDSVAKLLKDYPAFFCPHAQADPVRFVNIAAIRPGRETPFIKDFDILCDSCEQRISFNLPEVLGDGSPISVECYRFTNAWTDARLRRTGWQWLLQIDPQIFNMKGDTDSKHILWCDGGNSCATNYGLLRYLALLREARSPFSPLQSRAIHEYTPGLLVKEIDHLAAIKSRHWF